MEQRFQLAAFVLSGTILWMVAGCAPSAAQRPAAPGAAAGEPETDQLAALEAELEQDEERLYASVRRSGGTGAEVPLTPAPPMQLDATAPASGPPPPPPAGPSESRRTGSLPPCQEACRAFASMQRTAQHICQLTGPAEPRCVRAHERVARAQEQLTAAGCKCSAE